MKCFCAPGEVYELKIEGEVSADPVWCAECMRNLDLEELPISHGLKTRLREWMLRYGEWIDWEKDRIVSNGIELEMIHNKQGKKLTEEVQKEIGEKYDVYFSPARMASTYHSI